MAITFHIQKSGRLRSNILSLAERVIAAVVSGVQFLFCFVLAIFLRRAPERKSVLGAGLGRGEGREGGIRELVERVGRGLVS